MALLGAACEDTTPSPELRAELEGVVKRYLLQLATAYSEMDASLLEGYATESEIRDTAKLIRQLGWSGDRVEATLLGVEFKDVRVFREINASVSLIEVWDIRRIDPATGREKARNPHTVQNSFIQLRKIEGKWMVTARRVQETNRPGKWKVVTPAPTPTAGG